MVTHRPTLTDLTPGPPHHAAPNLRGLSYQRPNKPSAPSRKLAAGWVSQAGAATELPCGATGTWLGMLMGPRGRCSQAAWPSAGQSRARQHVAAAAGAPGTEGSQGARSLLQPGWGSQVVLRLVWGSGSEHRLSFCRRSSTPRPRMRGQIRPMGTNGKAGITLATPTWPPSLPPEAERAGLEPAQLTVVIWSPSKSVACS